MSLPSATTSVFQGMFLFFLLATDVLVGYRLRWVPRRSPVAAAASEPVSQPVPQAAPVVSLER
jgi:simple sugar transport system permease protein